MIYNIDTIDIIWTQRSPKSGGCPRSLKPADKSLQALNFTESEAATCWLLTLRVQSTRTRAFCGFYTRNRNKGFGNILCVWVLGPLGQELKKGIGGLS